MILLSLVPCYMYCLTLSLTQAQQSFSALKQSSVYLTLNVPYSNIGQIFVKTMRLLYNALAKPNILLYESLTSVWSIYGRGMILLCSEYSSWLLPRERGLCYKI